MSENVEQAVEQAVENALAGNAIAESMVVSGAIISVVVIIGIICLRFFLVHLVRGKKEILDKEERRWINRINNGSSILALVLLCFLWAPQLQTFALSLTAVAVALVLTTKELLMCLTGGILRSTSKAFDIGDWITVDGMSGEVMKFTSLATLVEEVDTDNGTYQFTGRTVQIPNSKFLTSNIENYNFLKRYNYLDLLITVAEKTLVEKNYSINDLKSGLQSIVGEYTSEYLEEARKYNKKVERIAAVDFPDADPQIFIKTGDQGQLILLTKVLVPAQTSAEIRSKITAAFLSVVLSGKKFEKSATDKKASEAAG